jgi:hypothetical protein
MMQRSILTATAFLVTFGSLVLAGCGVGGGTPESKISETTDNYLRALSSGDTTKACAQLTAKARGAIGSPCGAAMEKIASRVGPDRLADVADQGSSISVDGSNGSATLKGLNGARLDMASVDSTWLIESGYRLNGRP